jgi:hypothetical protein
MICVSDVELDKDVSSQLDVVVQLDVDFRIGIVRFDVVQLSMS